MFCYYERHFDLPLMKENKEKEEAKVRKRSKKITFNHVKIKIIFFEAAYTQMLFL